MGTLRLGKRTDKRVPKIKDFVPLADLNDLVFASWDLFTDNAYEAALKAGVLDTRLVERSRIPGHHQTHDRRFRADLGQRCTPTI